MKQAHSTWARGQLTDNERHLLYYALCAYDMISDVLGQKEPPAVT